jgi:lysozyme
MSALSPSSRPAISRSLVSLLLHRHGVTDKVALVGIRGYFRNTMGIPGRNDVGLYDDAIVLISPTAFVAFNANTDPSRQTPTVATLAPGIHRYCKGRHGISRKPPYVPYAAFRPATVGEKLPVTRGGKPSVGVAINIHKGGATTTSSEGCQTIVPGQWAAFQKLAYAEMDRHRQTTIPYLLVENDGSIA